MSGQGTGGRRTRAQAAASTAAHEADPWWSAEPIPVTLDDGHGSGAALAGGPGRPVRRRRPTGAARRPLPIALAHGILRFAVQRIAASPRMRRLGVRTLVFLAVSALIASAGGVIMLNNVVIRRSAELGALDGRRGELRTENALLGAEAAKLSAPQRITREAQRIGMAAGVEMPRFIYLDPANQPVTPRRRALALRAAQRAARSEQPAAAAAAAQASAADSAKKDSAP